MKRTVTFFTAIAAFCFTATTAFSQNHYVVQSPDGEPHLLTFDISTGTQVDSIGVQVAGGAMISVSGFNGMARHPISNDIYVAFKDLNSGKHLGILDPTTGDIAVIGSLTTNSSSITFDAAGTLYAMSGQGSADLYTLNTADATATLFHTYTSAGDDGESIGVNTTDGLLYRYDGGYDGAFTSLDLTTLTETFIDSLNDINTWGGGFYYNEGADDFTFAAGEYFYNVQTDGTVDTLSNIVALNYSGNFKGIVRVSLANTNELDHASVFSIYPNPSNGVINIDTDENFKLEVVDVKGSVIQSLENVNSVAINQAGIYFLRFTTENGVSTQKIIIE